LGHRGQGWESLLTCQGWGALIKGNFPLPIGPSTSWGGGWRHPRRLGWFPFGHRGNWCCGVVEGLYVGLDPGFILLVLRPHSHEHGVPETGKGGHVDTTTRANFSNCRGGGVTQSQAEELEGICLLLGDEVLSNGLVILVVKKVGSQLLDDNAGVLGERDSSCFLVDNSCHGWQDRLVCCRCLLGGWVWEVDLGLIIRGKLKGPVLNQLGCFDQVCLPWGDQESWFRGRV
jgi:hypothetical protein